MISFSIETDLPDPLRYAAIGGSDNPTPLLVRKPHMLRTLFNTIDGTLIAFSSKDEVVVLQQMFDVEGQNPNDYVLTRYRPTEVAVIPAQPWFAPAAIDRFLQKRWAGNGVTGTLYDCIRSIDVLNSWEFKDFMLTLPLALRPKRTSRFYEFYMNMTGNEISVTIENQFVLIGEDKRAKYENRTESASFNRGTKNVFNRKEFYILLGFLGVNWTSPITRLVISLHIEDVARITVDCIGHKKCLPDSTRVSNGTVS